MKQSNQNWVVEEAFRRLKVMTHRHPFPASRLSMNLITLRHGCTSSQQPIMSGANILKAFSSSTLRILLFSYFDRSILPTITLSPQ